MPAASAQKLLATETQGARDLAALESRRQEDIQRLERAAESAAEQHEAEQAQLRDDHAAALAALREEMAAQRRDLEGRMASQREDFDERIAAQRDDFDERLSRASTAAAVNLAVVEEQAASDSEHAARTLAEKTNEWQQQCDESSRLADELAASCAARADLERDGEALRQKLAEIEAASQDAKLKFEAEVARLEELLSAERGGRAADCARWTRKVQELAEETERSVATCAEVQQRCDANHRQATSTNAALAHKTDEWREECARAGGLTERVAELEVALAAEQEALLAERREAQELRARLEAADSRAEQAAQATHVVQLSVGDLRGDVQAARGAAGLAQRRAERQEELVSRLASALGSPRAPVPQLVLREWRRALQRRRKAQDAVGRWRQGCIGLAWQSWQRACFTAKSLRIREQIAAARRECEQREVEVREGAQSLVEATEARFEGEIFTLQKKLHIATLSPGSPSVRKIFDAAAPEPEPRGAREETPRIGAQTVAGGVDDSDSEPSSDDSDDEEFHEVSGIEDADEQLPAITSLIAGAAGEEVERLRSLLEEKTQALEQLSSQLEERDASHQAALEAEVQARLSVETQLEEAVGRVAASSADCAASVARVSDLLHESAAYKRAEEEALRQLLELQAKFEDAEEGKVRVEAELAAAQDAQQVAFAQLMELQAKYEDQVEDNALLASRLAEAAAEEEGAEEKHAALTGAPPLRSPFRDRGRPHRNSAPCATLPLLGMAHSKHSSCAVRANAPGQVTWVRTGEGIGRTKAAATAFRDASAIADYFEKEALSTRAELEKEVVLRQAAEAELAALLKPPVADELDELDAELAGIAAEAEPGGK